MQITVNGRPEQVSGGCSLAELVGRLSDRSAGVAVAVNAEVVPRSSWPDTVLAAGDQVEVVTAVQGG